jgi:hypothetical protein
MSERLRMEDQKEEVEEEEPEGWRGPERGSMEREEHIR